MQPIENPEKVESLPAEVGLPDMQSYLQQSFQMDWRLDQYYQGLPEVKAWQSKKS